MAADELRAELAGETVTFVVNRNINFTNVCVVGCAFCGFGQGRRSPDAYHVDRGRLRRPGSRRRSTSARPRSACRAASTPTTRSSDYGRWLRLVKEVAPQIHLHAYSPMEIHYMCERSGRSPEAVFEYLLECGLGSTPGTAAEVLHDGVRAADLAEQAPGRPLGGDHRGLPPRRAALDLDRDVRPHRGAVGAGPPHAGRARAPGAHRRDHRVRAAQLHPLQHAARPHPRRRGDLARREPQAHRGVPAGPRQDDHRTCRRAG